MAIPDDQWDEALRRAQSIAEHSGVAITGPRTWDYVAVRGIIAITVWALAHDMSCTPDQVADTALLATVLDPPRINALVQAAFDTQTPLNPLPVPSGAETTDADRGVSAWRQWVWLTRRWEPDPSQPSWGGLPRGIARGVADPALHVGIGWAQSAVSAVLERRHHALGRRTPVTVAAGEHAGRRGIVETPAWRTAGDGSVIAETPRAYTVTLTDSARPLQVLILTADLAADTAM